jgi:hypothetical protein
MSFNGRKRNVNALDAVESQPLGDIKKQRILFLSNETFV